MEVLLEEKNSQAVVNGVFGELLQGVRLDNEPFLVTNPVDIYSLALFHPDPSQDKITVIDPRKFKAQILVDKIFHKFQLPYGGTLQIDTQFPVGKGLGSSSADLVAVVKSISNHFGFSISPQDTEEVIRGIEPSDGVMYQAVVSFFYKKVKLDEALGKIQGGKIIAVDQGGEVDTVSYNEIRKEYSSSDKKIYSDLYASIRRGLARNNIRHIGKIATQSAELNQKYNEKVYLNEFLKIARSINLPGLICAHSGTYLGFLLDTRESNFDAQEAQLRHILQNLGLAFTEFLTI